MVVFLPQILILFLFILVLEATGYMVRAAFLMDRLMSRAGLSGRAFIPLLSSFACAVPGIMATRTIDDPKDRLTTILVAPLMTCSARLPVYTLIIGAFIADRSVAARRRAAGAGDVRALHRRDRRRAARRAGPAPTVVKRRRRRVHDGTAQISDAARLNDIAIGLWQRAAIFLKRAGAIILVTTIILWALASFPAAGPGQKQSDVSIAGKIADGIHVVVAPIGFNKDIASRCSRRWRRAKSRSAPSPPSIRSTQTDEQGVPDARASGSSGRWSLPTALAFLAWFVFAPQCISTIAVTRRETNGWKWPLFMVTYLFVLAYLAAGATYWLAVARGTLRRIRWRA